MPYVAIGRVAAAIKTLQPFHAFFGITFLSMKKSGVGVAAPVRWGSKQENELLAAYYSPPGAFPDRPFFVPFGTIETESGPWKNPKYSGGTLQRARTTDNFKDALVHPDRNTWAFLPNYLDVLVANLPKDGGGHPLKIPVFDLVAWIYRDLDLPVDFGAIVEKFRAEFNLDDDAYSKLFIETPQDAAQFFFAEPLAKDEFIQVIGGVPEGPSLAGRGEQDLVKFVEEYVANVKYLALPDGFVRAFYFALKSQRFVVLAGRPGTGKTAFARAVAEALGKFFPGAVSEVIVSVGPDFGESDVIGYEKIAGDLAATELTRQLFLSGRPRDLYFVILDEMNLAQADHYFARLLPAIESDAHVELPGQQEAHHLPPDTFVVGTVNSFVEESTRLPLSGPVKRRANVIEMPNLLATIVEAKDRARFDLLLVQLLEQTLARYKARAAEGQSSVLDEFRMAGLVAALAKGSAVRSAVFADTLWNLCLICAGDPQTSLTLGVLQDVLDFAAMAGENVMAALDLQVAQKVVPQLGGPAAIARQLHDFMKGLRASGQPFDLAITALGQLLLTEDPSSGMVYFRY